MAPNTLTHRGPMSGYTGHGPERRADAGAPHAAALGGSPVIGGHHPSLAARPLSNPSDSKSALRAGARAARYMGAQFPKKNPAPATPPAGGGMTWTAATVPGQSPAAPAALPPGPGMPYSQGWTPHANQGGSGWGTTAPAAPGPSYGGAAYNNGGGPLANARGATKIIQGQVEPPDGA